jgi:hypothetical protein
MSRGTPIIGLYATNSILPRLTKVDQIYGPDWPCSIQAGILTYFLRFDPRYGVDRVGPALSAYYNTRGSDYRQGSLLVHLALLRNDAELQPLVGAALKIRGLRWPQPAPGTQLSAIRPRSPCSRSLHQRHFVKRPAFRGTYTADAITHKYKTSIELALLAPACITAYREVTESLGAGST